jgi:uncharacterized protein with HEPN domain
MSLHKIEKYLLDVISCIDSIKSYTLEIKTYEDFVKNKVVYRAVERELEIIAEAITRIKKIDASLEINNSTKIIGLRNRVIHAYDSVNHDIVWGVVVKHLDSLKAETITLLSKNKI